MWTELGHFLAVSSISWSPSCFKNWRELPLTYLYRRRRHEEHDDKENDDKEKLRRNEEPDDKENLRMLKNTTT